MNVLGLKILPEQLTTYLLIALRIVLRYYLPTRKDGKSVPHYLDDEYHVLPNVDRVKASGTHAGGVVPIKDKKEGGR